MSICMSIRPAVPHFLLFPFTGCTEISQETAVNPVDIVSTLQSLQMLKYWKGKHLVLKRQVGRQVNWIEKTVKIAFFGLEQTITRGHEVTEMILINT